MEGEPVYVIGKGDARWVIVRISDMKARFGLHNIYCTSITGGTLKLPFEKVKFYRNKPKEE